MSRKFKKTVAVSVSETNVSQLPPFLRKTFPLLHELKARANDLNQKPGDCWPSLILNAQTKQIYRPDIRGPFSIFMNRKGISHCTLEGTRITLPEDTFLISNTGQYYSLEIDAPETVETFNLHLGNTFMEEVQASLRLSHSHLLDEPQARVEKLFIFPNRLNRKTSAFSAWIETARQREGEALEAHLMHLILYLLQEQKEIQAEISRLPALRKTTREELHKRLNQARDCLYSDTKQRHSLDHLAQIACLSKYHFLRLFRAAYGCTPYQYQLQLRIEKSAQLLRCTKLSVQDIAFSMGFDDPSSFSRLFYRQWGLYPSQYRNQF
ncbi:hypothetical protein COW36_15540 [bacterium (Candidatus Blackallbacteria) CG17_big_fil_post_rev_8_21_14_2_50_48_46]|uniref:HTH araC/xylS-type domain-containing protein n=1 Tax=bacterium (Candidatus Blackallbacteria) CG17_big_fil_post_rev_8_21_14_2_50_48_46 TaxID=2014261 RepID=A0A2M7G266_9BACT|nr:MAG: hypothetical protein COW64_07695 [bacterium (Candidatus Blackallbacteria) CG18_big_fil_WC_8_21_14_2_50_49_26]PIW15881.1 MAG: hypothetical protein COW36_15540 [bacterium (Candidatus Blackallbacteria) CG17_big_fil_post_rev_8_21_14_2_50_48_46]PIW48654.1 MAG: hypothetical protein COW20_08630 [bacterium (Candidatus Blackallbacteria) CG13_big_fil_rev_8_21_14_2_50_49_14]